MDCFAEVIQDYMDWLNLDEHQLSIVSNIPEERLLKILYEDAAPTITECGKLEKVFQRPKSFWQNIWTCGVASY